MDSTLSPTGSINISDHAIERARQRLGWSARSLRRMASRVVSVRRSADEISGVLHRYLEEQEFSSGALARSYGENLFIFQRSTAGELTLVTVWQLPAEVRGVLRRRREKVIRE